MTQVDGTPIWFELTTPDAAAAAEFYTAVVGWSVTVSPLPEHGGYRVASAPDGQMVAGMMTPPPGTPGTPGWTVYFSVADVDAAVARVGALGGATVFGPMDIPHVGRFAIVTDPQGVALSLMTGAGGGDATAFLQGPEAFGHGVWIELATPDPDGALTFYGALFGWEQQGAMSMGPMGDYVFLGQGEARPGAVMSSATTGAPARWNAYMLVPDIDAAIATATTRGGTLIQGPDPIPGGDYSANIADPHGSQLGLVGKRVA